MLWRFIFFVFISLNIIINVGAVVHSFVQSFHIQIFFMFFKLISFAPPSSFWVVFFLNIGYGIYILLHCIFFGLLQHLFCYIISICVMLTSTRLLQCHNVLDFMCASFWMLLKVLAMLAFITLIHCFVFWFYMMFLLLHCCNLCSISIYKLARLLWCFGSYVCITLNVVESDSNVVVYAIIPWIALFFLFYYATFALLHYCLMFHVIIVNLLYCCDFLDLMCGSLWTLLKVLIILEFCCIVHLVMIVYSTCITLNIFCKC